MRASACVLDVYLFTGQLVKHVFFCLWPLVFEVIKCMRTCACVLNVYLFMHMTTMCATGSAWALL